jgi:PAS domain S-box-containing protein
MQLEMNFIRELTVAIAIFDREFKLLCCGKLWDRDIVISKELIDKIPTEIVYKDMALDIKHLSSGGETAGIVVVAKKLDSERKFQSLFDNSLDAILLLEYSSGKFADANPEACKIYGYSKDEFANLSAGDLDVIYSEKEIRESQNSIVERGWDKFVTKHKTKDGKILDVSVYAVRIEIHKKPYMLATVRDITEDNRLKDELKRLNSELKKRVQQELNKQLQSIQLFKDVIDSTTNTIALLDKNYRYIIVNRAHKRLHRVDNIVGKTALEAGIISKEYYLNRHITALEMALAGKTLNFKSKIMRGDELLFLHINMSPFKPADTIEGIIIIATDITKEYYLEKENFSNQKKALMGDLISIIAHQLKQPLNSLQVCKELLLEEFEYNQLTEEILEKYSSNIDNKIGFMAESIDSLKDFFKPNKTKKPFAINRAIEKALSIIENSITSKGIKVIKNFRDDSSIDAIESEFEQVVINILNNAKDVILERGTENPFIQIESFLHSGRHIVEISDNAGGVEKEIINSIFNSYFSTKGENGTGIGLKLSKMIVEDSMLGRLSVKNSDTGAVFSIKLKPHKGVSYV